MKTTPPKPAPAISTAESVEEFVARGGTVEKLDDGAHGRPVLRSLRDAVKMNWSNFQIRNPDDA